MDNDFNRPKTSSASKLIIVFLLLMTIVLFGGIAFLIFSRQKVDDSSTNKFSNQNAVISGVINVNGVVPNGATLSLTAKEIGSSQAVTFESNVALQDGNTWAFDDAKENESYQIQAVVMQNGVQVDISGPITVTAPADDEILTLNLVSSDAPEPQSAVISGNIQVNGYIPSGATITIQGRTLGEQEFTSVATGLTGQPTQFMSYATAIAGTTYEVQGQLIASDGITNIGTSSTLTVTAPALNETLTINSTAQPPVTPTPQPTSTPVPQAATATPTSAPVAPVAISGSIDFNGVAPPNSRIVIFQKVYNSGNYQVAVDNITPTDGATWTWSSPAQSTWYDMIAVLKQRQSNGTDVDLSTSSMASVAAPATNVSFTLNSGFTLNAPSGNISVSCGNLSGATWFATLSIGPDNGAASYWYQIGTTSGGVNLANSTQNVSGTSPLTVSVSLTNGTTYYVQYAYSTLQNLNAGSSQFSPFSQVKQIQCN